MKKRILIMFLGISMVFGACGAKTTAEGKDQSQIEENETTTPPSETSDAQASQDTSVDETDDADTSTNTEDASAADDTTNADDTLVTDETLNSEESSMVIDDEPPVSDEYDVEMPIINSAAIDGLSDEFLQYIMERCEVGEYSTTFNSDVVGCLYGASFCTYDVNKDGKDDLLISGALGLRCKEFSEVYLSTSDGYQAIGFDGYIMDACENYLYFSDPDYAYAGAEFYESEYIVAFEGNAEYNVILSYYNDILYYDLETDQELEIPMLLSEVATLNGNKISKENYEEEFSVFKFEKILEFTEIEQLFYER